MTSLQEPRVRSGGVGDFLWALAAKREYGLAIVLALILITVSVRSPDFLKGGNIESLLVYCAQPAIVACGVMLVIVTGEIDISVGSMLGLLTYPILVEPYLTSGQQAWMWSISYVAFVLVCATVAWRSRGDRAEDLAFDTAAPSPGKNPA